MKIALAGNPNSGKTTMFNALTGSNEKVGNWAGVTVDKKEHSIKKIYYSGDDTPVAVDLPGAYSMSAFTSEESVTSDYIKRENPDVIINIVDATNLSRSLFFTTQLLELQIPVVIALNKSDINEKKKTKIDIATLSQKLNCPIIETISTAHDGLAELVSTAVSLIGKTQIPPYREGNINHTDKAAVAAADRNRFRFVNAIVKTVERRKTLTRDKNFGDKIDAFITNKWLGIPVFAAIMFLVFQISQVWIGQPIADLLVAWLETLQALIAKLFINASPLLKALLVDGVIGGVIAVIGFLPLVMVMYFLIALLEDCGYMSRVAVVLDPIFKKVGLSGKSVIPFVISVGCAVPGVMASRTVRNERERRATAMLAPFMPCGAKIPVISLFAGAFFGKAGWVSAVCYLSGILIIFLGALLINGITGNRHKKSYFIIELPEYKFPSLWGAFKSMCSRGWSYIVKAATIILLCNTVIQIMQSFTWHFTEANETASNSILYSIASPFAYLLIPIVGVISWQLAAAAITGFIAKENVVGTLAVCFAATKFINVDDLALNEVYASQAAGVMTGINSAGETVAITAVAALAYLMFNLFSPPCFAAIGAMNAEMKSAKWLWGGIGLQLAVGYTVAFLVYQIGTFITTGTFGAAFIPGLLAVIIMAAFVCALIIKTEHQLKSEGSIKEFKKKRATMGK